MTPDGIVNFNKYVSSKPKILFILKETNEHDSSLTKLLNKPFFTIDDKIITDESRRIKDLRPTWFNIARWTYGLTNLYKNKEEWLVVSSWKCI